MAYTLDDLKNGTSLGYSYTKDGKRVDVDKMGLLSSNAIGSYIPTSEEGVMYDVETGEYRRVGTATPAPAPEPAPVAKAPAPKPVAAAPVNKPVAAKPVATLPEVKLPEPPKAVVKPGVTPDAPVEEKTEIYRALNKTGAEAGGSFQLFKGTALTDKSGLTADRLRIGGTGAQSTGRDIKKKKQLDTLGLNVASAVGLGI